MTLYGLNILGVFPLVLAQAQIIRFPWKEMALRIRDNLSFSLVLLLFMIPGHKFNSYLYLKNISKPAQSHLPSSFFSLGTLLVASSIQFPSAECFSSKGFPTNTRSSRHGSSASFRNSATNTKNMFH